MAHYIKRLVSFALLLTAVSVQISCSKYLDEKPNKKLVIPSTLADLQAMLDYTNIFLVDEPFGDEMSSDNFYLPTTTLKTLSDFEQRMYTWEKDNIFSVSVNDWSHLYAKIYYANAVLDGIEKIDRTASNQQEWDNIKGQALMQRGKAFMQAVLLWSPAFDPATAATDLGIPLRLSSDFNEKSVRATVQQTYDQVISDLSSSLRLLPNRGIHPYRSSKATAFAFLARTFLSMRIYAKAGLYADSSLQINSSLLDYNTLNATAAFPIPLFNAEMNSCSGSFNLGLYITNARVDSLLYASYAANDCRKTVFFKANTDGSFAFKGSYTGSDGLFYGIATDEMFLTRAECNLRAGNIAAALVDFNGLLSKRMKTGTFTPVSSNDPVDVLRKILDERRKELIFRGTRWMDIKRLNKEGAGIIQKRIVNNQTYILPPNDLRYALPIPEYVINISGMQQNPR